MLTDLYPMVQFAQDTWEIDEFDCASMFLLVGRDKAMLIDTGTGIGDLKRAVRRITDKPLVVVITHGHIDHTGNARQFDEVWIHPKDADRPMPEDVERRRGYAQMIAEREKGIYPYDLAVDVREPGPDEPMPTVRHIHDGQQFDLGGRTVTAYECAGHSAGEIVLLDESTRSLFAGDAVNYNLGIFSTSIEVAVKGVERLRDMDDQYDGIYNGHHDFRALGAPLGDDCLPNAIDLCRQLLSGDYAPVTKSFVPGMPAMTMVVKDQNQLCYREDNIHEAD